VPPPITLLLLLPAQLFELPPFPPLLINCDVWPQLARARDSPLQDFSPTHPRSTLAGSENPLLELDKATMPLVTELDLAIQGFVIGVVTIHDDAIVGHNRRMYHFRNIVDMLHLH
jgi:hypothetical protein